MTSASLKNDEELEDEGEGGTSPLEALFAQVIGRRSSNKAFQ